MAKPTTRQELIDYCLRSLGHPVIEINVDDDQLEDRTDEAFQFYQEYHSDAIYKDYLKHQVTATTITLTTAVSANFAVNSTITGGTSGATAEIIDAPTSTTIRVKKEVGDFQANETITSGAVTATIDSIVIGDLKNEYIPVPDVITTVQRIFPLDDENSSINMFDVKYQIHLNDLYDLRSGSGITTYYQTQQYLRTLDLIFNGMEHIRFNRHLNRLYIDCDWENEIKEDSYIIVEIGRAHV